MEERVPLSMFENSSVRRPSEECEVSCIVTSTSFIGLSSVMWPEIGRVRFTLLLILYRYNCYRSVGSRSMGI